MPTKTAIAALLALPLLILGCGEKTQAPAQAPTSAIPGQDKQAAAPSSPDKMLATSPPASGAPPNTEAPASSSTAPSMPPSTPPGAEPPAKAPSEPSKSSY